LHQKSHHCFLLRNSVFVRTETNFVFVFTHTHTHARTHTYGHTYTPTHTHTHTQSQEHSDRHQHGTFTPTKPTHLHPQKMHSLHTNSLSTNINEKWKYLQNISGWGQILFPFTATLNTRNYCSGRCDHVSSNRRSRVRVRSGEGVRQKT
jgi:hypothetical protein